LLFFIEQDRGLEELSKIIGRQRQMAQAIGEEVESQNGSLFRFSIVFLFNQHLKCFLFFRFN
jgi:hypothetical protein